MLREECKGWVRLTKNPGTGGGKKGGKEGPMGLKSHARAAAAMAGVQAQAGSPRRLTYYFEPLPEGGYNQPGASYAGYSLPEGMGGAAGGIMAPPLDPVTMVHQGVERMLGIQVQL